MKADKTALILIEFQNDFCKDGGKLYDLVKDEIARNQTIENAVKLLKGAREKNLRVLHCPFVLDRAWADNHNCEGLLHGLVEDNVFAPETWGVEIIDELKPIEGETILKGKRAINGFEHTNLSEILTGWGVENVGVCGFLTNVCAQATAWGAYDRGYRTRLIPSACGAASRSIQEFVEKEVCPIFGGAPTVDEFLAEIQG
ncbi:MAG: cysteine hydrolase family protein [Thermoguttaceae bacterium]|jgi:nicotinamidase-related amidase